MKFSELRKLKAGPPPAARPEPAPPPAPAAPRPEPEAPAARPAPAPAAPPQAEPPAQPESRRRAARQAAARPDAGASFDENYARAREIYSRLLAQAGSFLKAVDEPYTEKYEAVSAACDLAAESLRSNPALLYCTSFSTADDYLRAHAVNTTLLALAMGLEAGLPPGELRLLGFCAMAHDIGMTDYAHLYNSEDRLGPEEFSEMSLHAEAGAAKLDRIVDLDYRVKERARRIVLQTHERADGSGYPDRAADEDLDPLAQLVSIADAYEAMTHPRAWRPAAEPADAVKELIEKEGRGFNAGAVRLLIAVISLYPPGAVVLLSTGELARVLQVNRGSLTRPLVELAAGGPGARLDLAGLPLTAIERGVSFAELEERDPAYAARLELGRWWVDWQ